MQDAEESYHIASSSLRIVSYNFDTTPYGVDGFTLASHIVLSRTLPEGCIASLTQGRNRAGEKEKSHRGGHGRGELLL